MRVINLPIKYSLSITASIIIPIGIATAQELLFLPLDTTQYFTIRIPDYQGDIDSVQFEIIDTDGKRLAGVVLQSNGNILGVSDSTGILVPQGPTAIVESSKDNIPEVYALRQNTPNPFNPSTKIKYDIPKKGRVKIAVYNMLGQLVITLVDKHHNPGRYSIIWDGTNNYGQKVATGIYLYRLGAGDKQLNRKMTLVK
jgi:hypothetical protein